VGNPERSRCLEAENIKDMCKVKSRSLAFAVLAAIAMSGGLAAFGQTKPESAKPQSPQPPNPSGASETSVAAVDPNKYLIGAEDMLFIKVWREPDYSLAAFVRPDGKITIPLVGEVQAGGVTPIQLTKSVTEALTKYINNPEVTVFVTEVRSKKYYLDGEVNRPGSYPLITPTTVLEALSNAGGFKEFANSSKIRILRGSIVLKFNYKEVTAGKKMEQNIFVENGDHIIVK
jgi:polysaccharide export outer membrane protein